MKKIRILMIGLAMVIGYSVSAQGDVFCVSTPSELYNALNQSKSNGKDDVIRLVQGTYNGNFIYISTEPYGVTIEGGYTANCASRVVDPSNTVLDGGYGTRVLALVSSANSGSFQVDGLTLQNGYLATTSGGGLYISADIISISHNIIKNNSAFSGGAIRIAEPCRVIEIIDNVIRNNMGNYSAGVSMVGVHADSISFVNNSLIGNTTTDQDGGAVELAQVTATITFINNVIANNTSLKHGGGIYVYGDGTINLINNTFVDNSSGYNDGGGAYLLCQYDCGNNVANIYNNIFWNNTGGIGRDLYQDFASLDENLFNNYLDQSPGGIVIKLPMDISNLDSSTGNPLFVDPLSDDFHLQLGSPCVDSGINAVPNPEVQATDMDGNPRIVNGTVDMGAYEYQGSPPSNQPPVAKCQNVTVSAGSTCMASASINDGSYDPDGDPITTSQSPAEPYPKGSTSVTLTVNDSNGASSCCTGSVTVVDSTPPAITFASLNPSVLWPPNHRMVNVTVNYNATDNCGQLTCRIGGVTSNEPISSSDYVIVDAHHVKLLADRLGGGNGRIYTITVGCTDASGNASSHTVTVTVPHDQRN